MAYVETMSDLRQEWKPKAVLETGLEGEIDIAVSQPIIDETIRVLREKVWGVGCRAS